LIPAQLEPDAIGVTQDTIIGVSNSAPGATVGLVLAGLAAATAYGSAQTIVLCGTAMLVIANSYRRLNLWNANCGASFEWVGRAVNPYLGFLTGWLMIAANLVGSIAGAVVLAPSVLAIFRRQRHQHLAEHPHRHRRHHDHDRDRGHRHPPDRAYPGRPGRGRIRHLDRIFSRGAGGGAQRPSRHGPGHQRLVQRQRHRRARQPDGGAAHRGVHVRRLGRHHLPQ
jgi:hypothetical protein